MLSMVVHTCNPIIWKRQKDCKFKASLGIQWDTVSNKTQKSETFLLLYWYLIILPFLILMTWHCLYLKKIYNIQHDYTNSARNSVVTLYFSSIISGGTGCTTLLFWRYLFWLYSLGITRFLYYIVIGLFCFSLFSD
jgi:hypothetical protein